MEMADLERQRRYIIRVRREAGRFSSRGRMFTGCQIRKACF